MDLESLPVEGILKDTDRLVRVTQQLSDLKTLQQPDQANSSPVPGQMRLAPDSVSLPGVDTKVSDGIMLFYFDFRYRLCTSSVCVSEMRG